MDGEEWSNVAAADELRRRTLQQVLLGGKPIALVFKDGEFSAIRGAAITSAGHSATVGGLAQAEAEKLVAAAHQVCPYSNATRGTTSTSASR